jgi:hypothetical protein
MARGERRSPPNYLSILTRGAEPSSRSDSRVLKFQAKLGGANAWTDSSEKH